MRIFNTLVKDPIRSENGFTLTEMVIVVALLGIVGLAVSQITVDWSRENKVNSVVATRDQLVVTIRDTGINLAALKVTLNKSENQQLKDCVCGGGAACTSMKMYPLKLYDASGTLISPQYYDANGSPCDPSANNCPIRVQTNFSAQCMPALPSANPQPPLSCTSPVEFFRVVYNIDQNPDLLSKSVYIRALTGAVYTQVSDFTSKVSGVCL